MKIKLTLFRTCVIALLLLVGGGALAQGQRITGNVADENGQPLPGATVLIKGTPNGTVTDASGKFALNAESTDILLISFVGYSMKEITIGPQTNISVQMSLDFNALEEIVVVGYGTTKKSDLISSVASVKTDEMLKVPSTDIGEMLRGKAPGLFVSVGAGPSGPGSGGAGPGSSTSLLLRGRRSLEASNAPLVIADGVPIGSINDVNPNDIESLDILKDAAAQAIYGARASNGVILITTKRGKEGKTSISYNGFHGVQTVQRNFDVYSGEEFAQLKRDARIADGSYINDQLTFTPTELDVLANGDFVNWEKELLQLASTTNHNLTVTSGTDKTRVFSSANYMNQQGVVPGTDFQKMTIRLNADQKVNEWLTFGMNTSWQISERNDPGTGGTLLRTVTTSPLGKIYNEDGSLRINPTGVQESFNPLLDLAEVSNQQSARNDIMNVFMDITPFKGFKYRINASRRSWNNKTSNYNTINSLTGRTRGGGFGSIYFQDNVEWQLENILSYDLNFGSDHKIGFIFVQSATESKYKDFRNTSTNVPNDILGIYGLEAAAINVPTVDGNNRNLLSYAGSANYSYAGKYYLNVAGRSDASSVFGANNKWAFFPAMAVGWNIHRENFMSGYSTISNLKLSSSYGSVGNQAINPYGSQSLASQRDYIIGTGKVSGFVPGNRLANPNLLWETSTTFNLGLDFGLFTNLISGKVEFYNTNTKDLLVNQSLPADLGYSDYYNNLGNVQNRGIELNINGILLDKGDLKIEIGGMFTRNRNKIISLYGLDENGDGIEDDDVARGRFIGRPIDVYFQYMPVGIYQRGEDIASSNRPTAIPGEIKLFDRDPNDGELNANDRVITERGPTWFGSFNYNMTYRNIDFSFSLYTVQGVVRNNNFLYGYSEGGSLRGILNGVKQDYWTPENPTGNWPRPSEANDRPFIWTMGLQDASYLRLQNITLGYSLPRQLLAKAKMTNVRLYVTGQNLFTKTPFQSYSPEANPNDYPEPVTLIGGLQVGF